MTTLDRDRVPGERRAAAPPMADAPPLPASSPEAGDPYRGERGHTTVAGRAVERIVAHALGEDGGLGHAAHPVKRVTGGPRIDADVDGTMVTARIRLAVAYPEPVREVANRVRDHVRARIQDLTGLTVRQVDIDVARLEPRAPEHEAGAERGPGPKAGSGRGGWSRRRNARHREVL